MKYANLSLDMRRGSYTWGCHRRARQSRRQSSQEVAHAARRTVGNTQSSANRSKALRKRFCTATQEK
eukprot:gene3966-2829_t